uniref:Uncharacterized protein n=1 Tax=Sinocyclocheilus rhinocerous TaxID=307959 RepID=A0A673KNV1_9TELE
VRKKKSEGVCLSQLSWLILLCVIAGQLEAALGMFYAPCRPLSNTVILEYRDPISRYARRFFHHLLRYTLRFEKAFLLAVDIGARDLFMVSMHFQTCTNNGNKTIQRISQSSSFFNNLTTHSHVHGSLMSVNGHMKYR